MHWIEQMKATHKPILLFMVLLLSACANQETLVPQDGPAMKDIYRNALISESEKSSLYQKEAEALCQVLGQEENLKNCLRKVVKTLKQHRVMANNNPGDEVLSYIPYTRDQKNELDNLFPRLPNPDLFIYVYPHLATKNRAPIPGYSTVIPLYERVQYQLPGEALSEEK